ncbi:MAG: hypothetical protein IIA45_02195 [Bacteroidetes bacterium]|nr:hypothetical protein [Bacteroidota bacterium]
MKFKTIPNLLWAILLAFTIAACQSNTQEEASNNQLDEVQVEESSTLVFDSALAQKLGADQYGMKRYVIAYLRRGPNRNQDSLAAIELQKAHLDNITRLANAGKLVLAGPFLDDGDIRGIYVFNVETVEEAAKLTATDPAIQAGSLVMELHPWYGSAAISQINDIHKTITNPDHD